MFQRQFRFCLLVRKDPYGVLINALLDCMFLFAVHNMEFYTKESVRAVSSNCQFLFPLHWYHTGGKHNP